MLFTQFNIWARRKVNIIKLSFLLIVPYQFAHPGQCEIILIIAAESSYFSLFTYKSPPTQTHWTWIMNGCVSWNVQIWPTNRLSLNFLLSEVLQKVNKQLIRWICCTNKPQITHQRHTFCFQSTFYRFFFCCWRFSGFSFFPFSFMCFAQRFFLQIFISRFSPHPRSFHIAFQS